MVEMTPDLKALFEGWRPLTPQQKAAVLSVIEAFDSDSLQKPE